MTDERDIVREIRLGCCRLADLMVNSQGTARYRGYQVRYGLGGDGGADLIGIQRSSGRFVAFEVKRPGWRPRNKRDKSRWHKQIRFLMRVRLSGGIGAVVDCVDDARGLLSGELDAGADRWLELPADREPLP